MLRLGWAFNITTQEYHTKIQTISTKLTLSPIGGWGEGGGIHSQNNHIANCFGNVFLFAYFYYNGARQFLAKLAKLF